MGWLQFTCPQCGGTKLEERYTDVIIRVPIRTIDVYTEPDKAYLYYHDSEVQHGEPCYSCRDCGFIICDEKGQKITASLELAKWLKQRGMIAPME